MSDAKKLLWIPRSSELHEIHSNFFYYTADLLFVSE